MKIKGIALLMSMASLMYELALAQFASAFLGGTLEQYILVLGFYIFFLGIGSFKYKSIFSIHNISNLELTISILGSLIPLWLVGLSFLGFEFVQIGVIILASLIGFLSGMELPLLMEYYSKKEGYLIENIMFFDYFGSLVGAIIFYFLIISISNLFYICLFIGVVNLCVVYLLDRSLWRLLGGLSLIAIGIFWIENYYLKYYIN